MKTNVFLLLLLFLAGLSGCELFENKKQKEQVFICGNTDEGYSEDELKACKPRDTLLANGVYIKYIVMRGKFSLVIGRGDKSMDLYAKSNLYDCCTPQSVVPRYQWSSDKVIALEHGCGGNYCTYTNYYLLDNERCVERMNVMAYDSRHNLISYPIERDSIVIEDVYKGGRIAYPISGSLPCANPMACIENVKFTGYEVVYTFDVLSVGKDKKVSRRFAVPKRLL